MLLLIAQAIMLILWFTVIPTASAWVIFIPLLSAVAIYAVIVVGLLVTALVFATEF